MQRLLDVRSVERLFEDSVANTPLPLTRVLRPANLSGVTFGFSCLDASVPLPVGAALAKCLLAIVGMGGDVVLPSNSTLLRTASFIELLSATDLQASHGMCHAACILGMRTCCNFGAIYLSGWRFTDAMRDMVWCCRKCATLAGEAGHVGDFSTVLKHGEACELA